MIENFVQIDDVKDDWILSTDVAVHFYVSVDQVLEFHLKSGVNIKRKLFKLSYFQRVNFILFTFSWFFHRILQDLRYWKRVVLFLNSSLIFWSLLFWLVFLLVIFLVLLYLLSNRRLVFSRSGFYLKFLQILNPASVKTLQLHWWCVILDFTICAYWIKLVFCIHLLMSHFMVFQNFPN